MVSLDLKSLYTHVTVTQTVRFLQRNFKKSKINFPLTKNKIMKIYLLIANKYYFTFNSNFYR